MRILVVEDEKILAESLKTGLLDEEFAVDVAYNGNKAYDLAVTEEYDAIVLDIMLPDMNGIEICKRLRNERISTPIIILTARDTMEDKIAGLDCGADDYLVKPFSFQELLARIRALIRRSHGKGTLLKADTLELNPSTHIVTRSGKEIFLTGKEYSMLEYFMFCPNQVLTREQILSHVWDYSYDSFSNIVDVFVGRIRNKIDRAFPNQKQLFVTIRGIGYKLVSS